MASKAGGKHKVIWFTVALASIDSLVHGDLAILFLSTVQRYREESPDVKLSKFLSYICRHGAEKEGIALLPGTHLHTLTPPHPPPPPPPHTHTHTHTPPHLHAHMLYSL